MYYLISKEIKHISDRKVQIWRKSDKNKTGYDILNFRYFHETFLEQSIWMDIMVSLLHNFISILFENYENPIFQLCKIKLAQYPHWIHTKVIRAKIIDAQKKKKEKQIAPMLAECAQSLPEFSRILPESFHRQNSLPPPPPPVSYAYARWHYINRNSIHSLWPRRGQ